MPIGINPFTFALGHQWAEVNPQHAFVGEHLNMRANLAKVLSYVPGLSLIVGILRIVGLFEKEHYKAFYPILRLPTQQEENAVTLRVSLRAIAEILSFSFLLLILDLIADFIRINRYERFR
jgi:hypothetical protein